MNLIDFVKKNYYKYKSIILYVFFGALTTLVNIITFWICSDYFSYSTVTSNILAWIISVAFAYLTNKTFVFESKSKNISVIFREFCSFVIFRIASGGIDTAIMFVCVDIIGFNKMLIKIASNVIVVVLNYIASKFYIFKKNPQ